MSRERAIKLHIRNRKQDEVLLLGPGNEPVLLVQWDGQKAIGVAPPANATPDESMVDSQNDETLNTELPSEDEVTVITTGTPDGPKPKDESREPKKDAPKVDRDISGEPDIPDADEVVEKATADAKGLNLIEPEVKDDSVETETESKTDESDPILDVAKDEPEPEEFPTETEKAKPKTGDASDLVDDSSDQDDDHKKKKGKHAKDKDGTN